MKKKFYCGIYAVFFAFLSIFSFFGCARISRQEYEITEDAFEQKTFPFIYIETEDNMEIVSKEEYISCSVSTSNTSQKYILQNESAKIKGRGNSTWTFPKKPYKLKFDSKIDLFGNGKAKTWTLIANYCDKSLTRNLMAYEIARAIGLENTTSADPVNLMVNGDYYGVYLLCEQVEIGKTRVNIESDLSDIDTGYLIEMDARAPEEGVENLDYFVVDGISYAVKGPETDDEDFSSQHMNFIKNYVTQSFNSLSADYETVSSNIDVESFAKCYIVHELLNCIDVGLTSFYMYKVKDGKLFAGPVWDFDISSGNCDYVENGNNYNYLYAKDDNIWYQNLLKFDEFKSLVGEILLQYRDTIKLKIDQVVNYQLEYKDNNNANFEVWPIMGIYVWPNPNEIVRIDTFEGQVTYLQNWVKNKLSYMENCYIG